MFLNLHFLHCNALCSFHSLAYLISFDTKFVNLIDISNYDDERMYALWQDGSFIRVIMPVNQVDRFHDAGLPLHG
ncbi:hypothetical protein QVD17_37876 [Tagetes erecta]|uniref:Uncharacterized protein n=1 Tax=Tagetes erecta TaxID=13708 RepID=A0AAD8JWT1_TARER|nr:hypothetical protein QVD17_37876 [Tagetes erecta]